MVVAMRSANATAAHILGKFSFEKMSSMILSCILNINMRDESYSHFPDSQPYCIPVIMALESGISAENVNLG